VKLVNQTIFICRANVETTAAPIADGDVTESIHISLANQNLLPSKHIVDTGYLDAELLVTSGSVNICYEIRNKLKSARFIDNHESRKPIFASTILNNFSHCSIERQNIANIYAS